MDTARNILNEALPIKCIEGVFLALYLTSELHDVERVPISFKSTVNGQIYRHIILAVRVGTRYGALGISRRKELAYAPLQYASLSDLMMKYKKAYEQWWHTLLGIKVGLPVPHSVLSQEKICWRFCNVKVPKSAANWERKVQRPLDKFARNWEKSLALWRQEGAPDDEVGRELPATPPVGPSTPSRYYQKSPKNCSKNVKKVGVKVKSMAEKKAEDGAKESEKGKEEDESTSSEEEEEEEDNDSEEEESPASTAEPKKDKPELPPRRGSTHAIVPKAIFQSPNATTGADMAV